MTDVIGTFSGREELECGGDQRAHLVEVTRPRGAQERLQFGERELDRIEVRAVRRQEAEVCADAFDRDAHLWLFVDRQVIQDDDLTGPQRGHEDLLHRGEETRAVDGAVKDGGGAHPVTP